MSDLPPKVLQFFKDAGRKGGKKSAATRNQRVSPERRVEIARHAAQERWKNRPLDSKSKTT